jgi:hypothetical protein
MSPLKIIMTYYCLKAYSILILSSYAFKEIMCLARISEKRIINAILIRISTQIIPI